MKLYQIPVKEDGKLYKIDPLTGSLIYYKNHKAINEVHFPQKLLDALKFCDYPFFLQKYDMSEYRQLNKRTIITAKIISEISKVSFYFSYKINYLISPVYPDSKKGIETFRQLYDGIQQDEMCLPKSIFAASRSKEFKKKGVIFIGVFLPSKSMHAWIIENGIQPDVNDNIWINFKPVAALC